MIPAIVFSKDRAAQLDLLLTSIYESSLVFDPVYVVWVASDVVFREGYERCQADHLNVVFVHEVNFREDTLALLEGRGKVCFFTDDDVVFGGVDDTAEKVLDDNPYVLAFSLRLGLNTTYCYPLDQQQTPPFAVDHSSHLLWEWEDAEGDFAYPMSLDGHVLRVFDVVGLIADSDFQSPNHLEDILARRVREMRYGRHLLASYHHSRLVGVPANRVQNTHPNRHAVSKLYPLWELNQRYLSGERIVPPDVGDISAAHQELELRMARLIH